MTEEEILATLPPAEREKVRTSTRLISELLSKLPAEEIQNCAKEVAGVGNIAENPELNKLMTEKLSSSWQSRSVSQTVDRYVARARFYEATGKLPEDVEKEQVRQTWPWLLVIVLSILLGLFWLRSHGVIFHCDNPDTVFGDCDSSK